MFPQSKTSVAGIKEEKIFTYSKTDPRAGYASYVLSCLILKQYKRQQFLKEMGSVTFSVKLIAVPAAAAAYMLDWNKL